MRRATAYARKRPIIHIIQAKVVRSSIHIYLEGEREGEGETNTCGSHDSTSMDGKDAWVLQGRLLGILHGCAHLHAVHVRG